MTSGKRWIALFLAMVMMFAMAPLNAFADPEEDETAESQEYEEEYDDEGRVEWKDVPLGDNGIPVISLTIAKEELQAVLDSEDHSYEAENCTIRIDVPEGFESEYGEIDPSTVGVDLPLEYFRGRGHSTWLQEKKPFKIKLAESADLLGMGANEHWVLMTFVKDGSMMRNRIASYMGRALGLPYEEKFVPVDFVINGKYQGSYMLGTQVRIGENRIEIDKIKKGDTAEPEITGGYLLALEPYPYDAEINCITTKHGVRFLIDTPDLSEYKEDQLAAQTAQREYVEDYLQQVEDAVFGEDFKNADGTPAGELMDLRSAAVYWWIQEFTNNDDAFVTSSTYLYKERNGKLYWGPLWDFDMAFWPTGEGNLNCTEMLWLDWLRGHSTEYQDQLREVWDEFDEVLKEITKDGGLMDRYSEQIRRSWENDQEAWEGLGTPGSLDERVGELKTVIDSRRQGIEKNIEKELANVYALVTFMDGDRTLAVEEIRIGQSIGAERFPAAEEKEGFYFLNWIDGDGQEVFDYTFPGEDMTVLANYIPLEDVIWPEQLSFGLSEVWVDLADGSWQPAYGISPMETMDKSVTWSVSDPSIAAPSEEDAFELKAPGTVTVTGTLANGISSSLTLHILQGKERQTVSEIRPKEETMTLAPGEYRQMELVVAPEGQPLRIGLDFSSDDEEVAVVDGSGMVSAVAPGTCTISVWEYESDTTVTYTVTVTDEIPETSAQETEQAATTQAPESSAEQAQTGAPSGQDGTDASTEPEGSGQAAPESSASGESGEKAGGSSPLVIWISVILGVGAAALLGYFRKKR